VKSRIPPRRGSDSILERKKGRQKGPKKLKKGGKNNFRKPPRCVLAAKTMMLKKIRRKKESLRWARGEIHFCVGYVSITLLNGEAGEKRGLKAYTYEASSN